MIVIRLQGGMGNQMFQYAFGRALSMRSNRQLFLETSRLTTANTFPRMYELNNFSISAKIISLAELTEFARSEGLYARVSQSKQGFNSAALLPPSHAISIYDGHWQSPLYFTDVQETVKRDFASPFTSTIEQDTLCRSIRGSDSICLHVRRTDYLWASAPMKVIQPSFYHRAIAHIDERVARPRFYVFSDDINWCRPYFKFLSNCVFVEALPWSTFVLMTNCRHFIIANSTFSWWAAWLGGNSDKTVIAPTEWFHGREQPSRDIIPKDWVRL